MPPVTRPQPAPRIRSRFRQGIPIAFGAAAALAALSLSQGSAQAYVVTVNSVQYDVTTFTGSYNDNISKFNTAANGGVMPWWGDLQKAVDFASAVGFSLSQDQNSQLGCPTCGPLFPIAINPNGQGAYFESGSNNVSTYNGPQADTTPPTANFTWAQATIYTVPGPGSLPLFGAGAAFGFSRKLRKRIQESRQALGAGRARA